MTMKEMEAKLASVTTSCEILKVKFQQDTKKAKDEMDTFRAKYEMGETRIKEIVEKCRLTLNQKVEESLDRGLKEWSAQAVELQVFRANAENQRKEGCGFYKMDEINIHILREYLTEEFHALAQTHTMTIRHLLEEFNDDQMLLRLDSEAYEREHIQAEKEEAIGTQTSTDPMTEEAA